MLEAVDGENLVARQHGDGAQEQAVAEPEIRERTAQNFAERGHAPSLLAGPDGHRRRNLRSVHALRLSALEKRLARVGNHLPHPAVALQDDDGRLTIR